MGNDSNYFVQRHEEECAAARQAGGIKAQIVHLDLAVRYAMRAVEAGAEPRSVERLR